MKILFLAPQPFYQERGTPIAERLCLQVLSAQGHQVDLLTFHEGADLALPGMTLHRIPALRAVRGLRPGFSWKKLLCDVALFFQAWKLIRRNRPHLIHAVEESAFMALFFKGIHGIPYLYDMDSSLAAQLVESKPALRFMKPLFQRLENLVIRHALGVIAVCPALEKQAAQQARHVTLLTDISLLDLFEPSATHDFKSEWGLPEPVALYVGNLEAYQGVDLLLAGFARAVGALPSLSLVVVGGTAEHIEHYRQEAGRLGLAERVRFIGPRGLTLMKALFSAADILVSPRTQGENTPMKIYSYLDSGKAILATDLPTHTQVLTPETACLAAPDPEAFGNALLRLARDAAYRRTLGEKAKALAVREYSFPAFEKRLRSWYESVEARLRPNGKSAI